MEVDSKIHPFLSYILSLKPLRQPLMLATSSSKVEIDVEANNKHAEVLLNQMPNLRQPDLLAKMTAAVSDVVQTRSVLQGLGERPDHEAVDGARLRISQIDSALSKRLEEIVLAEPPPGYDPVEWRSRQAQIEKEARDAAEKEKLPYKAVVHLYDMHLAYEDLLKEAEARLVRMYRLSENEAESAPGGDEVDEKVVRILQEDSEKSFEKVELRGRMLRFLPEAFGKFTTLLSLDLSYNKLEVTGLREDVQLLCRATNLLGKQMIFLEEDAEIMIKEYQFWMKEHETYRLKLEEEQRATQEMFQVESSPLVNLEEEILQQQHKINCLKGEILRNEEMIMRILKMVTSGSSN